MSCFNEKLLYTGNVWQNGVITVLAKSLWRHLAVLSKRLLLQCITVQRNRSFTVSLLKEWDLHTVVTALATPCLLSYLPMAALLLNQSNYLTFLCVYVCACTCL